jgi:hypothetical protein
MVFKSVFRLSSPAVVFGADSLALDMGITVSPPKGIFRGFILFQAS